MTTQPPSNGAPGEQGPGATLSASFADYSTARVRDLFLASLETGDRDRTVALAHQLMACRNPLPSVTCLALGLPAGSSYGAGARAVLAQA